MGQDEQLDRLVDAPLIIDFYVAAMGGAPLGDLLCGHGRVQDNGSAHVRTPASAARAAVPISISAASRASVFSSLA